MFPDLAGNVGLIALEVNRAAGSLLLGGVDSTVPLIMPGLYHVLSQGGLGALRLVPGTNLVD